MYDTFYKNVGNTLKIVCVCPDVANWLKGVA